MTTARTSGGWAASSAAIRWAMSVAVIAFTGGLLSVSHAIEIADLGGDLCSHRRSLLVCYTLPGFPATHASRSASGRAFTTCRGSTQPRRAWSTPQRRKSSSLTRWASESMATRQPASIAQAGPLRRQVEPGRRPVDLERRARRRRCLEDGVPVQVEVGPLVDDPAGGVRDDIDVRAADGVEGPSRQLVARLAPPHVHRRDDQVEAGQQVVVVVEPAVRAHLELAAVEEPEARHRPVGHGPRRLLGRVPLVQRRDDAALLLHPRRVETVCDGEALRVVRQHLVGVPSPSGRVGHDPDRVDAVAPVGVRVEVALEVAERHRRRQPAVEGGRDLAAVLAQLGQDLGEAQEAVHARLVGEGPQLGVRAGRGLAVGTEPHEAPLRQAPAAVARDRPQRDVVRRRAREVDEVRARLTGRHDHEVHLGPAEQRHARLRAAGAEHAVHDAEAREAGDDSLRIVRLDEQVQVADRLAPTAEGPRRDDAADARDVGQLRREVVGERLRPVDEHPSRPGLDLPDAVEDPLLGPGRDAAQAAKPARLRRVAQVLERLDAESLPDRAHGLRPHARHREKVDETGGHLRPKAFVERHVAGRHELDDLVADRAADARDGPPVAGGVGGRRRRTSRGRSTSAALR